MASIQRDNFSGQKEYKKHTRHDQRKEMNSSFCSTTDPDWEKETHFFGQSGGKFIDQILFVH